MPKTDTAHNTDIVNILGEILNLGFKT